MQTMMKRCDMPRYPKNFKDVEYRVPGRRRPVTGSTKATRDFLALVHEQNPRATITELRTILTDRSKWLFNPEAGGVLDAHIRAGFGGAVPNWR